MGSWRRQKGESRHQGFQGTRSQDRKPPSCNWLPTVPSWEKKFCSVVGSVPWHKIVEAKKFMCLYKNIVEWDDSAGEEAFWNAKSRFWAKINRLPCDMSLPDPNEYIDNVDWDSALDIDLLLDLDREPQVIPENDDSGGTIIFGDALLDQSFSCTGWGDCDDNFAKDKKVNQWDDDGWCKNSWEEKHNSVSNDRGHGGDWDDRLAKSPNVGKYHSNRWCKEPWEDDLNVAGKDQGWGTEGYYCWGWNELGDGNLNGFGNYYWNPGEKRLSSGGFGYNWSSNHRNRKHERGLKRNGTFASALRT